MARPLEPISAAAETRSRARKLQGRSARIRFLRRALPAVIVLVAGGLAGWLGWRWWQGRSLEQQEAPPPGSIRLVNPTFYGRERDGVAYVLSAKEAVRDTKDTARIALTEPNVRLNADSPRELTLTAKTGVYREDTKGISLSGDVRYADKSGNSFDAPSAVIDNSGSTIAGTEGFVSRGPLGQITAKSYSIINRGEVVRLGGGVRGVLPARGAAAGPGGQP